MLLSWKDLAKHKKATLTDIFGQSQRDKKYLAILFPGDNTASETYVRMKQRFGRDVWLDVKVFDSDMTRVSDIFFRIDQCNHDDDCVGIIIQLPLPVRAQSSYSEIVSRVVAHKDVDGLGGINFGLNHVGLMDFLPATPQAVMSLMRHHQIPYTQWSTIVVIGQSRLVGRPLADHLMDQWATVSTVNEWTDPDYVRTLCQQADIIISATGVLHLVDESFVRHDQTQYIIDVGRGKKDGKAAWDVNPIVEPLVAGLSPVPGWVWPLTIVSLFENIVILWGERKEVCKK